VTDPSRKPLQRRLGGIAGHVPPEQPVIFAGIRNVLKLHLEWYDWTLRGGPKPQFLQKNAAYYVMGAEKWRYADSLDAVTARFETYYLSSVEEPHDLFRSGSLSLDQPNGRKSDQYVYDPRDTSAAELESTLDPESRIEQRMTYAVSGQRLIYHSAPFPQDTEVSGFFGLTAWFAIDQLDTDIGVAIYEVALDGGAILLSTDWMRARYREGLRESRLIQTREP
jgi:hypothetical protein